MRLRRATDRASRPPAARARKPLTSIVDLAALAWMTWLLETPDMAMGAPGLDIDRAGGTRPGCRPPGSPQPAPSRPIRRGSRKPGKLAPLPQCGTTFSSTVPARRLPGPVAVAVAVGDTIRRNVRREPKSGRPSTSSAISRSAAEADHLAKQIELGARAPKAHRRVERSSHLEQSSWLSFAVGGWFAVAQP